VLALVSGGYESACIRPEDTWGRKPAPIFNSDFQNRKSETFCMTHVSKVGRRFSTPCVFSQSSEICQWRVKRV